MMVKNSSHRKNHIRFILITGLILSLALINPFALRFADAEAYTEETLSQDGSAADQEGVLVQDTLADAKDEEAPQNEPVPQNEVAPQNEPAPTQENPAPTQENPAPTQDNPAPTQEESFPAFDKQVELENATIRVQAQEGVFPADATLVVEIVPQNVAASLSQALDNERGENVNVAASYTFDIKVVDAQGQELQPAEGNTVQVSFSVPEIAEKNLDTAVYHLREETEEEAAAKSADRFDETPFVAEALAITEDASSVTVETEGFSYYTVEFHYGDLSYVMQGDTAVPLKDILDAVGLAGEVDAVETSDPGLFSASKENGEWVVTAHRAFSSEEWLKVTISGLVYDVALGYGVEQTGTQTLSVTDAAGASLTVNCETAGDVAGSFDYVVKVMNGSNPVDLSSSGGTSNGDGSYTFTIANSESFTIPNIPQGCTYEVSEIVPASGWQLELVDGVTSRTNCTGTMGTTDVVTTFTNRSLHSLTFGKTVTGNMGDKHKEFKFEIRVYGWKTVYEDNITGLYYDSTGGRPAGAILENPGDSNAAAIQAAMRRYRGLDSFTARVRFLKDGTVFGTNKIADQYDDASAVLTAGTTFSAGPDRLGGINDTRANYSGATTAGLQIFEFMDLSAYASQSSINPSYTFSGIYSLGLYDGDSVTISDIPYGYTYEIEEAYAGDDGYTSYVDGEMAGEARGTIEGDTSHSFVNDKQTDDIIWVDSKKPVTITKIWANDKPSVRPDINDVTMNIKRSASYLVPGPQLEVKIKSLAGEGGLNTSNTTVTAIKQATKEQYDAVKSSLSSVNEVQAGGEKTYMWFDSGTIYYYSEADTIFMNESSGGTFRSLQKLTDISGLAGLNTYYVSDMNRIFQNCFSLVELGPIAGWDVSHVTDFTFSFGSGVDGRSMAIDSLEALRNWDMSNVATFNQTFKYCTFLTTLEPIAGWDVSRLTDIHQMFNWCTGLTDEGREPIKDWNVACVTNWANMFNHQAPITQPVFTDRPGSWDDSGNYLPDQPYDSDNPAPKPERTKKVHLPESWDEAFTSHDSNCVVVDNGNNTWTYTFTVADDDGAWHAWETTTDGMHLNNKNGVANAYTESSDGTDGLGGSEANAVTGVVDGTTITNTNGAHDLTVKKETVGNVTGSFEFTIKVGGDDPIDLSGVEGLSDNGDGTYSFTIANGGSFTIPDIPIGFEYEVVETVPDGWQLELIDGVTTKTKSEGTMGAEDVQTTFTNRSLHSLTFGKEVTGNMADKTKEFEFTVRITGDNTVFAGSPFTFKLKDGETKTIDNIPYGYTYEIIEKDYSSEGYTTKVDGASGREATGTIVGDASHSFENDKTAPIPTGKSSDTTPWRVSLLAGGVVALGGAALYTKKRRAKASEREELWS